MSVPSRQLAAYFPAPVLDALLDPEGCSFPRTLERRGAVLFADVSGFTAMTEALAARGREGGEALTRILNGFFSRVLEGHRDGGGTVLRFLGDAMVIFYEQRPDESEREPSLRALAASVEMQARVGEFREVASLGMTFELRMKVGIGSGRLAFHLLGEEGIAADFFPVGEALAAAVEAEHHADIGDIRLSPEVAAAAGLEAAPNAAWPLGRPVPLAPSAPVPVPDLSRIDASWETLALFLPRAVPSRIREGLAGLGAEIRRVTTSFVSFGGLPPSDDPGFLEAAQQYFVEATRIVERFGGRLNRIDAGDKGNVIHLLFGAPETHGDDEERAVLAALALRDELPGRLGRAVPHAIGVNSGLVFCGDLGSADRHEYTLMGDPVNLAARLMQAARPGEVYFSVGTANALRRRVAAEELPSIRVKGKSAPVRLFRPVEVAPEATGHLVRHSSPLVGRLRERSSLRAALRAAIRRESRFVSIVGEAGVGKSRLADELARLATDAGLEVLRTEGRAEARNSPFHPFVPLLRRRLGVEIGSVPTTETVESALDAIEPGGRERAPLLAPLLGGRASEEIGSGGVDTAQQRLRTLDTVLDLLLSSPAGAPIGVLVEDAHFLDASSRDLLARAARRPTSRGLLLGSIGRPGSEIAEWRGTPGFVGLSLAPLSEDEVARLATDRLGIRRLPAKLREFLVARCRGNPLFLEQLLAALTERGLLDSALGDSATPWNPGTLDLPETLQGVVQARLDRLPARARDLLRVASVFGRQFDVARVERIAPFRVADGEIAGDFTILRGADLVTLGDDGRGEFLQELVRDTAYEGILFETRRELHLAAGRDIETTSPSPDDAADLLAHHYRAARHPSKALEWLERAGDRAARAAALESAAALYRDATSFLASDEDPARAFRTWSRLAEQYRRLGKGAEAVEASDQLLRLSAALGDPESRARAQHSAFNAAVLASQYEKALSLGESGLRICIESGLSTLIPAFHETFCLCWDKLGRYAEVEAAATAALETARAIPDDRRAAEATISLVVVRRRLGKIDEAISLGIEALEVIRRLGLPDRELICRTALLLAYERKGDFDAMREQFEAGSRLAREQGVRGYAAPTLFDNYACALLRMGRHGEARPLFDEALSLWRDVGSEYGIANCYSNLGVIEQLSGNWKRATALHEKALEYRQRTGEKITQIDSLGNLGEIALERGNLAVAESRFADALAIAEELGDDGTRGVLLRLLADISLRRGDLRGFVSRFRDGLPIVERLGLKEEVSSFLRLSGNLKGRTGHPDASRHEFTESLRLAREAGSALHEVQTLRDWGTSLDPREPDAARQLRVEALEVARRNGLRREAHELEKALGLRRRRTRRLDVGSPVPPR